ncbi:hypothetical protein QJS04_geneDACA012095 [Acorus gramineus]|uniref:Uncharacterized protein n=1 Tax=Acorus gramineus TaxID=55184 RepID=A0AAV9B8R6_ACOGR|nr:hypothetical protein QJS04_geneDACA012095 [Acorus gramineus]
MGEPLIEELGKINGGDLLLDVMERRLGIELGTDVSVGDGLQRLRSECLNVVDSQRTT